MKIGLLVIATEILEGKIKDLNGHFLSEFLRPLHLELHTAMTVRDQLKEIQSGLSYLNQSCDVLIISGGLGPTDDDLTKFALANFLNKEIFFSNNAQRTAEENYTRLGKVFPGKDHPYSFLPQDFSALSNSTGFAPGLMIEHEKKLFLCAPGVPREFKSMIQDHFLPWIKKHSSPLWFMENITIRTKKIPEEKIFNELDPNLWLQLSQFGDVSSLPFVMGVDIGVKIRAHSIEELESQKKEVLKLIQRSPVFSHVWSLEPKSLESQIISVANQKKIKFSFAESCTGGLCSHRITSVSGSSQTFMGSIVCYDESVKENIIGVSSEIIKNHGVVSAQTAEAMAREVAIKLNTQIGISTTGFAGPTGGTPENPTGTVFIGFSIRGQVSSERFHFFGDREIIKERFAQAALFRLLELLEEAH